MIQTKWYWIILLAICTAALGLIYGAKLGRELARHDIVRLHQYRMQRADPEFTCIYEAMIEDVRTHSWEHTP